MFRVRYTDKQVIQFLKGNDDELKNKVFNFLYHRYFPMALSYVRKNKGGESEAKDVFQEALISFYENIVNEKFRQESSISTYLYAIVRNYWLSKLKNDLETTELTETHDSGENLDFELYPERSADLKVLLHCLLNEIGEPCRELLRLFYYDRLPMVQISNKMGYSNEDSVKTQKYKCMQKLMHVLRIKPELKYSIKEKI